MKSKVCFTCLKPAQLEIALYFMHAPVGLCFACAKARQEFHRCKLATYSKAIREAEESAKVTSAPAIPERYEPQTS